MNGDIARVLTALDDEDLEGRISGDQAPCDDTRCRSTWIKVGQSSQMARTMSDSPPAKMISNSEDISGGECGREYAGFTRALTLIGRGAVYLLYR